MTAWEHIQALLDHYQQKMPDGLNDLLEAALQAKEKQQAKRSSPVS